MVGFGLLPLLMRLPSDVSAPTPAHRFTRVLAAACALAVWLLGVLSVSPELHGHVHDGEPAEHHECAVTLFQHGAENPAEGVALTIAPAVWVAGELAVADRVAPLAVDVRLQPSCGPPVR
ncbi:MAG: hypothetical protein C0518_02180 [Opitutus sp.]|nr:hypothetical protein [Opitutus sp.]